MPLLPLQLGRTSEDKLLSSRVLGSSVFPLFPSTTALPSDSPFLTCSPRSAWWMVRLLLLCIVKRMALPVWLNRGAPATYTHPCLEDTTDVTVYPAAGGNRLVSALGPRGYLRTGPLGEHVQAAEQM